MEKVASIAEMQKFHFGKKIFCSDGEDGVLVQVVFDPATRRMTHIGVKQGRLFGKIVYLPFETVVNAIGEGVTIRAKREEIANAHNTAVAGILLDIKSSVELTGGSTRGTLSVVAVQPGSGELAYIVAHHLRQNQDTMLRQEYVTTLASGQVTVSISAEVLANLPPYHPDSVLQREVENMIFEVAPIHVDMKGMTLRILDGVLYMGGNISSSLRSDIVQDQASGVPGLLEIKNHLVGDDTLASDLAMALGQDARTRDLPIGVYPRLGVVRLSGAVHTGQQKAAAEEVARNFPGVRSVVNELVIDPKADILRVMSSAEGGETDDKVPGKYVRHTK